MVHTFDVSSFDISRVLLDPIYATDMDKDLRPSKSEQIVLS